MSEVDLFGPIPEGMPKPKQAKKYAKRGYYMPPGTGPKGETCGSCKHLCGFRQSKVWFKCGRSRAKWSHTVRTDIKKNAAACSGWAKRE